MRASRIFWLLIVSSALAPAGTLRADPVTNLAYAHVSSDTLSLTWDLQPETSYQVVLSTAEDFSINLASAVTAANRNTTAYFNLQPNTSHTFLVKVSTDEDANYLSISTYTLPFSPGAEGFGIFTSSASSALQANGNPPGTVFVLEVSSDGFDSVAFSSAGPSDSSGLAPALTAFGLQPNTTYQLGVSAVNFAGLPSTRTVLASTSTLAAVPGQITLISVDTTSVSLSWNPGGNPLLPPTSYQLRISTDPGFNVSSSSETFLTSASTLTLSPNTTYHFKVSAFNRAGGQSDFGQVRSTATLALSPGSAGFGIFTTSAAAFLQANGNPPGTVFVLEVSSDGFDSVAFSSAGPSGFSGLAPALAAFGLLPNTTYQLGVSAVNFAGLPSTRTVLASTSTLARPPGTPTATSVGTSSITVSWSPNGNPLAPPTSYQLQISTDPGFIVSSASETFLASASTLTLTANTSYYFRVLARGRGGDATDFSSSFATYTWAGAPAIATSPIQDTSSLQLLWQSANPAGTRIEISSSTDDFSAEFSTPVTFAHGFSGGTTDFTGLRENASYYFRLRALNENGIASPFSAVLATRTASRNPEGVSNLAFDGAFATLDGEIRWTWTAPGGDEQAAGINAASYIVRFATFDVGAAEFETPQVSTYTQTWNPGSKGAVEARTVTGLYPGTTYFFAIKGVDAVGNLGLWSTAGVNPNRSYFATDLPLSAPTNPQFTMLASSSVGLAWTAPAAPANVDDRDAYRVYQATYAFSSPSDPYVTSSTSVGHPLAAAAVTGLENETTYYFRVSALDKGTLPEGYHSEALESPLSAATMTVTLDRIPPASVSDLTALTGPNEGEVVLQWTGPGDDETSKSLAMGSVFQIKYTSNGIIDAANYASPPAPAATLNLSTQAAPGTAQGVLVTGLAGGATYWFAVKTLDESGNASLWKSSSDVASVNTALSAWAQMDNVAPAAVTGLSLVPTYKSISVTWISPGDNGVSGVLSGSFKLKYGTVPITDAAEFDSAATTVTFSSSTAPGVSVSTAVFGLANNATYYFAVAALDDQNNQSAFSAGEVRNDFPRNQSPGAFTLSSPADNAVVTSVPQNVAWNASTDADAASGDSVTYSLELSTRADFTAETLNSEAAGASTNKNIAGALIEDSTTYWRVRAADQDGAGALSDVRLLRINTANLLPSAFSLLTPVSGSSVTTLTPTLAWEVSSDTDPGDGVTYTLKISTLPTAEGGTTAAGLSTTSAAASTLTENATYYWKVVAASTNPFTGTDSVQSNATFFFLVNSVEEAPNAFSLVSPGDGERQTTLLPVFTWHSAGDNDPGNTVSYTLNVQNAVNSVIFSTSIPNLTVTTHTLAVSLTDNAPYVWSVVAESSPDDLTRIGTPTAGRIIKVDTAKELPAAVTLSAPTHQSLVSSTAPTLSWTATTDPDNTLDYDSMDKVRYIIKIGVSSDYTDALGQQTFLSDSNGLGTQRQFALQDQTTYFWQVAAAGYQNIGSGGSYVHVDTGGLAGCQTIVGGAADECYSVSPQFSFIVSLTNTPPSAPVLGSPADLAVLATKTPAFDWSDSAETDPAQTLDYILQISSDPAFVTKVFVSSGIAASSFTMTTPLLQNRTYFWRVLAQDHFAGGNPAGSAVASVQTFSFRVPVLTTPKEPTSVKGTLSDDGSSFALTWAAAAQNTDGSGISDLDGYNLYRSCATSGLGEGDPFVKVASDITAYTDASVAGKEYYYTLRAVNTSYETGHTSGTISANSGVARSVPGNTLLIVPSDPDLTGKIEITVPEGAREVLEAANNSYGEDLKFNLARTAAAGLKNAIYGVRIGIRTARTDKDVSDFSFSRPITVSFPLEGALAAARGFPAAPLPAIAAADELAVFWHNGVEWINLGGVANAANTSVFARTKNIGEFAVRSVVKATEFEIFSITPKKVFTPNGDGCNDLITFQYQNPKAASNIKGKIFDIYGAFVAEMKGPESYSGITFNSNCAAPNLADDSLIWDGRDSDGDYAGMGVYIYQIESEGKVHHGTVVIAR